MMNRYESFLRYDGHQDMINIVNDMLVEGYELKEITISNKTYHGKVIRHLDITNYVCIEFVYDRILFAPLNQINNIVIVPVEDEV